MYKKNYKLTYVTFGIFMFIIFALTIKIVIGLLSMDMIFLKGYPLFPISEFRFSLYENLEKVIVQGEKLKIK